jgi:hypothetical protein
VRALVWLREETWEAAVDAAAAFLPPDAEVTLLHVADAAAELAAEAPRGGLLGRRHPPPQQPFEAISEQAARELLAAAAERLARPASTQARRGRPEDEVLAAAEGHDILVAARDGDRARPGPHSLAPPTRFVTDHAACAVLLAWPDLP